MYLLITAFSSQLTKITVEAALSAEMQAHLGYALHENKRKSQTNSRNGYSPKTLKGDHGEVTINTPRDREASFEPQLIRKGQTRVTGMDSQILSLYAKGMSTRDIGEVFEERCMASAYQLASSPKSLIRSWTKLSNGKTGHWMQLTPLFIWTVLSSK